MAHAQRSGEISNTERFVCSVFNNNYQFSTGRQLQLVNNYQFSTGSCLFIYLFIYFYLFIFFISSFRLFLID